MRVYFDRRDWWVGAYLSDKHIYVCPLPTLVFRFTRHVPLPDPQCPHWSGEGRTTLGRRCILEAGHDGEHRQWIAASAPEAER